MREEPFSCAKLTTCPNAFVTPEPATTCDGGLGVWVRTRNQYASQSHILSLAGAIFKAKIFQSNYVVSFSLGSGKYTNLRCGSTEGLSALCVGYRVWVWCRVCGVWCVVCGGV